MARREAAVAAAERAQAERQQRAPAAATPAAAPSGSSNNSSYFSAEVPAKRRPSIGFGGIGCGLALPPSAGLALSPTTTAGAPAAGAGGKAGGAYASGGFATPLGADAQAAPGSPPASAATEGAGDAAEVRSPPVAVAGGQLFSYLSPSPAGGVASPPGGGAPASSASGGGSAFSAARTPPLHSGTSAFAPVSGGGAAPGAARPAVAPYRSVDPAVAAAAGVPASVVSALAGRLASATTLDAAPARGAGPATAPRGVGHYAAGAAVVAASGYAPPASQQHLAISIGRADSPSPLGGGAAVNTTAASVGSTASAGSAASGYAALRGVGRLPAGGAVAPAATVRRVGATADASGGVPASGMPLRVAAPAQPTAGAGGAARTRDCTLGPAPQLRRVQV